MCGIAGFVNLDGRPAIQDQIKRMTDAIAHRGPDGEGQWVDGPAAIGHRRLSIIDLSDAARQPMVTENGRYVLTYNGEIYNFKELRADLESEGVHFFSQSDSEVVLRAVIEWGIEPTLRRLNGMFAFGLFDKLERRLILARDRFGVKPLYFSFAGDTLIFGSEIKAITAHAAHKKKIDLEGLVEYLTFQNFLTERTIFEGVHILPAGCYAEIEVAPRTNGARHLPMVRYWDFHFEEPTAQRDEKIYLRDLGDLFQQAVERQLVSDVDVGSYLSGGMDSGSITAVAARKLNYMRSFTCGFDLNSASGLELSFDERAAAEHMSYLFKTEHYEMVLKSGDMERCMPKLAWHLEEPRVGQSYPNFYISQLASKFNKVMLAGTGGDELFGGYPWRYYRAVVNANFDDYVNKYYAFWQRLIPNGMLKRVCAPIWNQVRHVSTRDIFAGVFASHAEKMTRPEDYVNHSLYFEAKTFLHGLMVVEDKLSMAHSLETRVPFLDNDLVDFAMRLPVSLKLGNLGSVVRLNENTPGAKTAKYFQKTNDGKLLLRKMMAELLPKEIVEREKQGFSAPDASWFKGESIDYVRRRLLNSNARIYNFLDYETVEELLNDHLNGQENRRLLIWSLLNLEELFEAHGLAG